MKFECGDLERALANPDLMAEAQEHLRECPACRNEYRIWNDISNVAKQLHCEWDSPDLWPSIRAAIEAEREIPKRTRMRWKLWVAAAAAAAVALFAIVRWPQTTTLRPKDNNQVAALSGRDLLTEQALQEVEKNETAYQHSIEELFRLAQPKLDGRASSPIVASYREKLQILDSAILETRSNIAQNRFNACLQTELAGLYREKRHTLQEVLTDDKRN